MVDRIWELYVNSTQSIYYLDSTNSTVSIFNLQTNDVTTLADFGVGPISAVYDASSSQLFITNLFSDNVEIPQYFDRLVDRIHFCGLFTGKYIVRFP